MTPARSAMACKCSSAAGRIRGVTCIAQSKMFLLRLFQAIVLLTCVMPYGLCADTKVEPMALEGQTFIHDPSTIVKERGTYYVFGTGRGILSKLSPDLIHWTNGPSLFRIPPGWTTNAVS